jgi:hypothetical protein
MSAINTPTTIAPDLTRGSARPTFGPQARRRLAWIAGSIAAVLLAGAGAIFWVQAQSSPTSNGAPSVGAVSDNDLMAHGGAGSVWTVSGARLR